MSIRKTLATTTQTSAMPACLSAGALRTKPKPQGHAEQQQTAE